MLNSAGLADCDGETDTVGEGDGASVSDGPTELGGCHVAIGVALEDALRDVLGVAAGEPHAATITARTAAVTKPRARAAG
jgi:hypothetical protein